MKPTDLPDARARMVDWMESEHGSEVFRRTQMAGGVLGEKIDSQRADLLYQQERARWRMAELFHVSRQMTELTLAAAATMPEFIFLPEDLPAEQGFMLFESPIDLSSQMQTPYASGIEHPVVAVLWSRMAMSLRNQPTRAGVWMSFHTAFDESSRAYADLSPEQMSVLRTPWVYDNEAWLGFSEAPQPKADNAGETTAKLAYITRCAWLLMTQQVASVGRLSLPRATQRRLVRRGIDVSATRVVTLRHALTSSHDCGSDREYHHQWIVRGHWRKQWYPSQERHVPIWIAPHVKGPDGAPLLGGEKVYSWTR